MGDARGRRRAPDAPAQSRHEPQIQHDIQRHGDEQDHQRRRGVSHRPEDGGAEIVIIRGDESAADDGQIHPALRLHLRRRLNQPQQRCQKRQCQQGEAHRGPAPVHDGEITLLPEGGQVLRPVELGEQDRKSGAAAGEDEDEQIHHRSSHAHGGKGGLPHEPADDPGIGGIVELLQNIPHQQRRCQKPQLLINVSSGEIQCVPQGDHPLSFQLPHT